jgi:hypothetical protein
MHCKVGRQGTRPTPAELKQRLDKLEGDLKTAGLIL